MRRKLKRDCLLRLMRHQSRLCLENEVNENGIFISIYDVDGYTLCSTTAYAKRGGHGLMEIGEDYTQEVNKGDIIKIPENTEQRITNTGVEDLLILCFCVPAFGVENYEGLE